jgi:hypothetical protein
MPWIFPELGNASFISDSGGWRIRAVKNHENILSGADECFASLKSTLARTVQKDARSSRPTRNVSGNRGQHQNPSHAPALEPQIK